MFPSLSRRFNLAVQSLGSEVGATLAYMQGELRQVIRGKLSNQRWDYSNSQYRIHIFYNFRITITYAPVVRIRSYLARPAPRFSLTLTISANHSLESLATYLPASDAFKRVIFFRILDPDRHPRLDTAACLDGAHDARCARNDVSVLVSRDEHFL